MKEETTDQTEEIVEEFTAIEPGFENPYVKAVEILNRAFDHFNEKYCENILNRPLITILSRGKKACLGWHWKNKWQYQNTLHTEIMIAAETLRRPINDILETLLHEMVHLWNSQHNVLDCSKTQYHNKNFKKVAEDKFFLEVDRMPQRGFALTSLSVRSLADVQEFVIKEGVQDFRLVRIDTFEEGPGKKKQYMINVSEEDYEWFQHLKFTQGLKSKETFALIRAEYEINNPTEIKEILEEVA